MTNPFEDASGAFYVLGNDEQDRCLWPAFAPVPAGWTALVGPVPRPEAMAALGVSVLGVAR